MTGFSGLIPGWAKLSKSDPVEFLHEVFLYVFQLTALNNKANTNQTKQQQLVRSVSQQEASGPDK